MSLGRNEGMNVEWLQVFDDGLTHEVVAFNFLKEFWSTELIGWLGFILPCIFIVTSISLEVF